MQGCDKISNNWFGLCRDDDLFKDESHLNCSVLSSPFKRTIAAPFCMLFFHAPISTATCVSVSPVCWWCWSAVAPLSTWACPPGPLTPSCWPPQTAAYTVSTPSSAPAPWRGGTRWSVDRSALKTPSIPVGPLEFSSSIFLYSLYFDMSLWYLTLSNLH